MREISLRDAEDIEIFDKAREKEIVIISKDSDFLELVQRLGPPPQLLWVTCGNVTNEYLCQIFAKLMPDALAMLEDGEAVIEIGSEAND